MKLRFKFFIFLVGLPSLALLVFLFMAFRVLVQDKTLYILEANMTLASSLAQQMDRLEWQEASSALRHLPLIQGVVFDTKGKILVSSNVKWVGQTLSAFVPNSALEKLADLRVDEGSFEDFDLKNKSVIYNFIKIPSKSAMLLLATPKESALRASLLFLIKAVLTLVVLISIAVGASWWLSKSMTGPLEILRTYMQSFAAGNFKIKLPNLGRDEIGELGGYFNRMVLQIQELIVEREQKLKIEVEMSLASDIQKKLFPKESYKTTEVEFSGYYEPASNCGGDWWFYFQTTTKFVVCIGDVTGHGVHSALLTSASRAAFAIIAKNFSSTSEAMRVLNHSIYETAQGSINMTCIIAAIDLTSGNLDYTNASHEAPIVLPATDGTVTKKQFVFLDEIHGPRLGERIDSDYKMASIKINPQQHIFFYSDGVTDICSAKMGKLGDRQLLKWLGESYKASRTADQEKALFVGRVREFRREEKLEDDLSYFFVKWSSDAKSS